MTNDVMKHWETDTSALERIARTPFAQRGVEVTFSMDGKHRLFLSWPTDQDDPRILCVCAANPSKAGQLDANRVPRTDNTVSRLRNTARLIGYGWLWVVNVRSFISTDPNGVPPDPDAIDPANDGTIVEAAKRCTTFCAAWGHLGGDRGPEILRLVRAAGVVPHALALTADGTPRHPRGLAWHLVPKPMEVT